MKPEIQKKITLFTENEQAVRNEFKWQKDIIRRLVALLYAQENKPVDCDAIRQCHDLIRSNASLFSTFRGNMALCIATMLSLKDDRTELFARAQTVYEMMKIVKFRASDYLVVAAYQIAAYAQPEKDQHVVNRAREFYDGMKAHNFFLTGQDDYIFVAMLGLSNVNVQTGTERIEQLYRRFKPEFWSENSVQSLAQVLVLSGDPDTAASRVLTLRDAFREQNLRLDKTYTLPTLGVLALLPVDINTLVQDVDETQALIRTQKGFGSLLVAKQELLLYAAAVVASVYAEDVKTGALTASVSTSIASILIAQQAAMIATISGAAAGAAAASSSN